MKTKRKTLDAFFRECHEERKKVICWPEPNPLFLTRSNAKNKWDFECECDSLESGLNIHKGVVGEYDITPPYVNKQSIQG